MCEFKQIKSVSFKMHVKCSADIPPPSHLQSTEVEKIQNPLEALFNIAWQDSNIALIYKRNEASTTQKC